MNPVTNLAGKSVLLLICLSFFVSFSMKAFFVLSQPKLRRPTAQTGEYAVFGHFYALLRKSHN